MAREMNEKTKEPIQIDLYHLQHGQIRPLSTYIPQDTKTHRCLQSGEPKEILYYPNEIGMLRKLTPRECFRLMGFLQDEIKLELISDSQLYKLAGNGWDINLASKIFKKMFPNEMK